MFVQLLSEIDDVLAGTLNSAYNEVTFNEKLTITKEISAPNIPHSPIMTALNEKPPLKEQNLHISFFVIGRVQCKCAWQINIRTYFVSDMFALEDMF